MARNSSSSSSTLSVLRPLRRFFRARVLGTAQRALWRGGLVARQWISPHDNPFLGRALRVEARKSRPLLTLLGAAVLALVLITGVYAWWMYEEGLHWNDALQAGGSVPPSLGSNILEFVAILTAGACAYAALYATRARAAYLLRQEVVKGTLDGLQLLPLPEERWVWMLSAHPTMLSLLIGAAGLPVYALAVWTQLWSPLDLLGTGASVCGYRARGADVAAGGVEGQRQSPTPTTSRRSIGKRYRKRSRWRVPGAQRFPPAQQLEVQRRQARLLSGLDTASCTRRWWQYEYSQSLPGRPATQQHPGG
jgi:ABC-type transport system involved in cytochrome c biogenesis permease component